MNHARLLTLAACLAACAPAYAQFKPTRPIEMIVHTGPGGGADALARFMATLNDQEKLGPVRLQVNNKTGGGGLTAMSYVVEKKGDMNAVAIFTGVWLTSPLTQKEAKVTVKDMTPIVRLVLEPAVIAVKADSPYKTLKEFVDAAKKTPGALKQSGGSNTSRDNVVRQLLMKETGANWTFISFPGGGERIAALLGGHVNMMVIEPQEAGEHIRAGNMRVLAQVSERRLPGYPNVPTLKEAGFEIPNVPQVRGIVAPPGFSPEAIAYYEDYFAKMVATPAWKKYLADNQFEDGYMKHAELAKFMDEFTNRMRDILKDGGVAVVR